MFNSIRNFIERGKKGYTREEMWSFNHWLSKLIAGGLQEFKENTHTYPNDIDDWEEWMKVLDEMIKCFKEQTRGIENLGGENFMQKWEERRQHQKDKLHRGLELLERFWYDLWD